MSFIISMEALVNLTESARQCVLKTLPYDRNDPKVDAVLQAKSLADLLVLYLNWRERRIPPAPRQVLRSPAFDTNLIDIMKHGDWTRDRVLEVLATEWPDEGVIYEEKGILDGPKSYTDEERAKLRAAGLSAPFVEINGRFFAPAGGISAAGTSDNA